eukprot:tig00001292_g8056.t1
MRNSIKFYKEKEKYYEFSNFHICKPFQLHWYEDIKAGRTDGPAPTWHTSEAYFQAQKFYPHAREIAESIATDPSPSYAFKAGRRTAENAQHVRRDWQEVKEDVMMHALRAKFGQPELRALLLGTGDALLVEHTKRDAYWGDGGDGSGANRLGHCLMAVRDELCAAPGPPGPGPAAPAAPDSASPRAPASCAETAGSASTAPAVVSCRLPRGYT